MTPSDAPQYREATLEQLQAYADMFGISYETEMTTDLSQNLDTMTYLIRLYMVDYVRLNAIEDEIFAGGRVLSVGQLQLFLSYDQMARGLVPRLSDPMVMDRNDTDALNYMVQKGLGDYITSAISTFNTAMSSTSGLWWSSGDQEGILPCTAQYFKYHVWGTAYDNEVTGAFWYPQATSANPEGWDGLGLGIGSTPSSGDQIDYFRRSAPSGASWRFWAKSDILSTNWPNVTESNSSCRSATNSLIIHYEPCSGI
jgi:hypothetical protein